MTHIEHAEFGFAGLFLPRTCTGRLAVVFPGFSVALPHTSQAVIAITCFLTRGHVRVKTAKEKLKTFDQVGDTCSSHGVITKSCKDTHLS